MAERANSSSAQPSNIDDIWAALLSDAEPLWLTLPAAPPPTELAPEVTPEPVSPAADTLTTFADEWIDERPLAEIAADYADAGFSLTLPPQPPFAPRRNAPATVIQAVKYLRSIFEKHGGLSWYQLVHTVQMVSGDEYKVQRIAEELSDAGVVIIERPRRHLAMSAATPIGERQEYERIAHAAFAHLPHTALSWPQVAQRLGQLARKASPPIRDIIIAAYAQQHLNRTEERELFIQLEQLHREYHQPKHHVAEADKAAYQHWRNLPAVNAIYNTICCDQLWLAVRLALRYTNRRVGFDDLFQEGCFGILRAIETFDYTTGNRFVTYANSWVKQAMLRYIEQQSNVIAIPAHALADYRKGKQVQEQLVQQLGRIPTVKDIARALDIKPPKWLTIVRARNVRPLAQCRAARYIADDRPSSETLATQALRREQIYKSLDNLTERERQIIILRYGLEDDHDRSLEEVAKEFGLTRERVRQIELRILARLRHAKYGGGQRLSAFLDENAPAAVGQRHYSYSSNTAAYISALVHTTLQTPRSDNESEAEWGAAILQRMLKELAYLYKRSEKRSLSWRSFSDWLTQMQDSIADLRVRYALRTVAAAIRPKPMPSSTAEAGREPKHEQAEGETNRSQAISDTHDLVETQLDESLSNAMISDSNIEPQLAELIHTLIADPTERLILRLRLDPLHPASHERIALALHVSPEDIGKLIRKFIGNIMIRISTYKRDSGQRQQAELLSQWLNIITARNKTVAQGERDA